MWCSEEFCLFCVDYCLVSVHSSVFPLSLYLIFFSLPLSLPFLSFPTLPPTLLPSLSLLYPFLSPLHLPPSLRSASLSHSLSFPFPSLPFSFPLLPFLFSSSILPSISVSLTLPVPLPSSLPPPFSPSLPRSSVPFPFHTLNMAYHPTQAQDRPQ